MIRNYARIVIFILLLFWFNNGFANTGLKSSGIGFILVNPTGLSFKFLDNGSTYFNGALSWSFKGNSRLYLHIDYILKRFSRVKVDRGAYFDPYFGIGVRLDTEKDTFGARLPLGISYNFEDVPFDTFMELTPALDLIPETDFDLGLALGIRFLF